MKGDSLYVKAQYLKNGSFLMRGQKTLLGAALATLRTIQTIPCAYHAQREAYCLREIERVVNEFFMALHSARQEKEGSANFPDWPENCE